MKKLIAINLFIICAVGLQAQDLSWDIKFFKGTERETLPITQIITMETGEIFQIRISADSDCFSYIITQDPQRRMHVLHDTPLKKDSPLSLGPMQVQEPVGTETVYVIMGLRKEAKLETAIRNYKSNPASRKHINSLQREIAGLQNRASGLGEPASTFIPSGGTARSGNQEHTNSFSGKSVYIRTITIFH